MWHVQIALWRPTCFLSSRRRHTRYWRDWSSDVCSSDLLEVQLRLTLSEVEWERGRDVVEAAGVGGLGGAEVELVDVAEVRSEGRRVGKECRSRWAPYH